MANTPNTIDYAGEDLATFLAKVNGDGTNADIYDALKSDAPGSEVPASGISTSDGQLLQNGRDDIFQAAYPNNRNVALGNGGLAHTTGAAKVASYNALPGELVRYDAGGGTFPVILPASPADSTRVGIAEVANDATQVTVDGGANTVVGESGAAALTVLVGTALGTLAWEFSSDDSSWSIVSQSRAAGGAPAAHAASHENGGSDEISVLGLSGLLADAQTPIPTAAVDTTAIHDNVAGEIAAITEKATPVGDDWLLIEDSAAADAKKRVKISSLPVPAGVTATATGYTAYGTTNTKIIRYPNRTDAGDITWTDSVTDGTYATVADGGTYSVSVITNNGATPDNYATNKASSLNNTYDSAHIQGATRCGGADFRTQTMGWTAVLAAGDKVWVSSAGNTALTSSTTQNVVKITRIGD